MQTALFEGQIWRFISFQFLHANMSHLLLNMLGLFFFGPHIERYFLQPRHFLAFYLISGMGGALLFSLFTFTPYILPSASVHDHLVGASAGIYAILVAMAYIAPKQKVYLYFFIPMSIRTLCIGILTIAVLTTFFNGPNAGGEAGHLGGALIGFLLISFPQWTTLLSPRKTPSRPLPSTTPSEQEIHIILKKASLHGLSSLSQEEKNTLLLAAKKRSF